jgi:hypothetical protein
MSSLPNPNEQVKQTLPDELVRHVSTLFLPDDLIMVRLIETSIQNGKKKSRVVHTEHLTLTQILTPQAWHTFSNIAQQNHACVFFGVCPRSGNGKDLAAHIRTVRCLWADLDDCSPSEAIRRIQNSGLPNPSVVINSGHGVHLYWRLAESFVIDDAPSVESIIKATNKKVPLSPKAEHLQKVIQNIASSIGGDATHDLSRILRLAGSINRKNERNGTLPTLCTLISCDQSLRYSLDEFANIRERGPAAPSRPEAAEDFHHATIMKDDSIPTHLWPELEKLLHNCKHGIVKGTIKPDRSGADFHLCAWAIRQGISKNAIWERVKTIGKPDERGQDYFDRTWKAAETEVKAQTAATGHENKNHAKPYGLPVVIISVKEGETNDHILDAIAHNSNVFQRGRQLVKVVRESTRSNTPIVRIGSLVITPYGTAGFREKITECAVLMKWSQPTKNKPSVCVLCRPPENAAAQILERGEYPASVKHLEGVIEAPTMTHDGRFITEAGYDQSSCLLYRPNAEYPPLPTNPTHKDARESAKVLLALISEFPFVQQHHRAVWLACLLTILTRHAIPGPTPCFLFDANAPGTGKSLLTDLIAIIALGRPMARVSWPDNDQEVAKVILALAIAGDVVCLWDNIGHNAALGSPSFDAALTSTVYKGRILGYSEMSGELPFATVFIATGNNVSLAEGDTPRRTLISRMECKEENPEERSGFKITDIKNHAEKNRGELVIHALTILKAFHQAGLPLLNSLPAFGSYEAWSRLIRGAVIFALCDDPDNETECRTADPCAGKADASKASISRNYLLGLVEGWKDLPGGMDTGVTASDAIRAVEDDAKGGINKLKTLRNVLMEFSRNGDLPTPKMLSARLRTFKGRVIGGRTIVHAGEAQGGVAKWKIETIC